MAEEALTNMERFKSEGQSAFVIGYTGEVGKVLVNELNNLKIFKRVVLIGRREVPLNVGPEFVRIVLSYSVPHTFFSGCSFIFCSAYFSGFYVLFLKLSFVRTSSTFY